MKVRVQPQHLKAFERLPRKDRPPLSEIAAAQSFKLIGWSTVTAGVYLLKDRSGEAALSAIPLVLFILIVWDTSAKLGVEPHVEREGGDVYILLNRRYWLWLIFVGVFASFVAWVVVFWLAPLIHRYGLANL